jgi:hypothetical protein
MFVYGYNALLPLAGENLVTVCTYTMPFDGAVNIEMWGEMMWVGITTASWFAVSSKSSPPPDYYNDMQWADDVAGNVFGQVIESRTFGGWSWLNAGAVITVKARIYVTAPNIVTLNYVGGLLRAYPAYPVITP